MKTTKDTKLTIRLSKDEKQKVQEQAKRMNLDTSKFVREHFIKLISEK
jgi:predicted transcriptional regulator